MELSEETAVDLLRKYSKDKNSFQKVLNHSKKVQEIALRYASKIKSADIEFIRIASLLHDIGRFDAIDTISHGINGKRILDSEGLPEKYGLVCERHLGAGISEEDIKKQGLSLPLKDYFPISIEEKIITVADNLVFGAKEGIIEEVIDRYTKELGQEVAEKVKKLFNEINSFC